MKSEALRVPTDSGEVSAVLAPAPSRKWLFVYAPGAGSNIDDPFALYAAAYLPAAGVAVLRFQFPYQEARRGGPNPATVLEATWRSVLDKARELRQGGRIVAGGRSMGGRIASQVVAAGEQVDALALFAYPLHPPGRPEQRRDEHLASVTVPALFCSGDRDSFASPPELSEAAALIRSSRLHFLEGADHGFSVRKSSGRTREQVWSEACDALLAFLDEI